MEKKFEVGDILIKKYSIESLNRHYPHSIKIVEVGDYGQDRQYTYSSQELNYMVISHHSILEKVYKKDISTTRNNKINDILEN